MTVTERVATLRGDQTILEETAISAFREMFRGVILGPRDPGYDEARSVWNGLIDKRPALIVRCLSTDDVAAAVRFARARDLLVAVRGCGHNVAGSAVCDGGLLIDLSLMKTVEVQAGERIARVQPGADWGDVDRETQRFGLATPGGQASTTGVAGFTLGGGMGFLRRKWGLACDNLVAAEIVTAEGEVVTASEAEHPNLFWAIRGGGGNFGIVTRFTFRLHPLGPEIYGAMTVYPFAEAESVLRQWRDFILQAPDEVTCDMILWGMPPFPEVPPEAHWAPVAIVAAMYAGDPETGEHVLQPVRALGTPVGDMSRRLPYVAMQSDLDALFPKGQLYYWKSLFATSLDDDVIDSIISLHTGRPSPQTLIGIRGLGGAMGRVPEEATAYGNRDALFNISLDSTWQESERNDAMIEWTRRAWAQLRDLRGGGVYLNFTGFNEENNLLAQAAYRRNYDRLVAVKRHYDPTNFFRGNINISP